MKTDTIVLSVGKEAVNKAINLAGEVAKARNLSKEQENTLIRLAEETVSLEYAILGVYTGELYWDIEGDTYELVWNAEAELDKNIEDTFIRMSSSGVNDFKKTLADKVLEIIKGFGNESGIDKVYAEEEEYEDYTVFYTDSGEVWEEAEHSILQHYADDVRVGIRKGHLQIKVIKNFSK